MVAAEAVATAAAAVIFAGKFVYRLHTFLLTQTKAFETREEKSTRTHIFENSLELILLHFIFTFVLTICQLLYFILLLILWRKDEPNRIYTPWLLMLPPPMLRQKTNRR